MTKLEMAGLLAFTIFLVNSRRESKRMRFYWRWMEFLRERNTAARESLHEVG